MFAAAALLAVLVLRWPDALHTPFLNDDYLFLDRTRDAALPALWGFGDLAFHWWRPWSRETHYWALQEVAGANAAAFHAANAVLWCAVLAAWWAVARRVAGAHAAAWAVAACAALAAWSLPLLWVAGVQDLWMLLWSLLAMLAWGADRRAPALACWVLAMLSKETAAPLPAVLLAYDLMLEQRRARVALRRIAPFVALALVWAIAHPRLGGVLLRDVVVEHAHDPTRLSPGLALLRGKLVALNADRWPDPVHGWAALAGPALALTVALVVLAGALRGVPAARRAPAPFARADVARFALAWAVAGLLPLLLPGLRFHAYYAAFAAFGVLLLVAPVLGAHAGVAAGSLAVLALLGTARDATPSHDWGEAAYQRRAAGFHRALRNDLLRKLPEPGAHARLYFVRVPDRVGLVQGDTPALRVWYDDPTLSGGFYSAYAPRVTGAPAGRDWFFRLDSLAGWIEVRAGAEDVLAAMAANPRWRTDHRTLAAMFAAAGDFTAAAIEHAKLAEALPLSSDDAFDAAAAWSAAGDSARALAWACTAAARPGARPELVAAAHDAGLLPR
ncbi:MAG: hypothetical protein U0704_01765 [Candidatus Eisenbacteria bacterium]